MAEGIFSKANDTKVLEHLLRECDVGEIVTYEAMSKALGRDVRKFCWGNLSTARKAIEKELQCVFQAIANEGIRREDDEGKLKVAEGRIKRATNAARRTVETLSRVDYQKLPDDKKVEHDALSTQAAVVYQFGKHATRKKILSKVKEASQQLSIGETLKMFSD